MAQDPANQPQPDPKNTPHRTPAEQGAASWRAPDDARPDTELTDEQAAEALRKINEVERKLEPRG